MELVCEEGDVMVSRILGVCSREEELNVWGDNIERATATTHTHTHTRLQNRKERLADLSADMSLLRPPVQNSSLTSQQNIIWLFLSSDGVFAGL